MTYYSLLKKKEKKRKKRKKEKKKKRKKKKKNSIFYTWQYYEQLSNWHLVSSYHIHFVYSFRADFKS